MTRACYPHAGRTVASPMRQEAPGSCAGMTDGVLTELPPSTFSILGRNFPFSGGGYFRLLPYRVVQWALRLTNRAGLPGVVYFHPWELDPGHPVIQIRWSHRFQHYVNLRHTERKLNRLLTDFQFVPMAEIHASVQVRQVAKISSTNNIQITTDM